MCHKRRGKGEDGRTQVQGVTHPSLAVRPRRVLPAQNLFPPLFPLGPEGIQSLKGNVVSMSLTSLPETPPLGQTFPRILPKHSSLLLAPPPFFFLQESQLPQASFP